MTTKDDSYVENLTAAEAADRDCFMAKVALLLALLALFLTLGFSWLDARYVVPRIKALEVRCL